MEVGASSGGAQCLAMPHHRLPHRVWVLRSFRRLQIVLGLNVVQFLLFLVHVHALEGLVGLVVEHHQIAIAHIKTR